MFVDVIISELSDHSRASSFCVVITNVGSDRLIYQSSPKFACEKCDRDTSSHESFAVRIFGT